MRNVFFVALLLLAAPALAAETLYERVDAKLAADPGLAASLGRPHLRELAWITGRWDVVATVQAGTKPRKAEHGISTVTEILGGTWLQVADRYPSGTQDLGFIGFDSARRLWVSIGLDNSGNAVTTTAPGWRGDRLVFAGDVTIIGVRAHLRQTMRRTGRDSYTLSNEERQADGRWRQLDTYAYRRLK